LAVGQERRATELVGIPQWNDARPKRFGGEMPPGIVLGDAVPDQGIPVRPRCRSGGGPPRLELQQEIGGKQSDSGPQCWADEDGGDGQQRDEDQEPA
jgi:hypothetical protein